MNKKFNPKEYRNKERVFTPVSGQRGISKLWRWNKEKLCYEVTPKCAYQARKSVLKFGLPQRITRFFETLDEARNWQITLESSISQRNDPLASSRLTFGDVVSDWKLKSLSSRAKTTQAQYQKLLSHYFEPLMPVRMSDFTSLVVDEWITYLVLLPRNISRANFNHELDLLSLLLNYHADFDDSFQNPIRRRHRKAIKLKSPECKKKDLLESDFFSFRDALKLVKGGEIFAALATVQFYQALRISEAAAISWEDVEINDLAPEHSRVVISKSVKWIRSKGSIPFIEANYKNSKANGGAKESPLFPESFRALTGIPRTANGLVFSDQGQILTYRQIQHAYNTAFKSVGLPYRSTHIMRHGGCRLILNRTGDLSLAQQVLGNKDLKTVQVYAQRDTQALNQYAQKVWANESIDSVATIGCKK